MHTVDPPPHSDLPQLAADMSGRLRARRPRVHCLTNAVAQNFTANVLLAAGCVPSMTISSEEIGHFVGGANALLVNLGTFDQERREATGIAVATASQKNIPWVLDPVFVDRAPQRAAFARELVGRGPILVRLNAAEFAALAERPASPQAIAEYALAHKSVVAVSGETDLVSDGKRVAAIANGHPLMARVTAMGCAGSALIAACLSVESDPWRATAAGLLLFGVAGELAARGANGPASFAVAFIDALSTLEAGAVIQLAQVT